MSQCSILWGKCRIICRHSTIFIKIATCLKPGFPEQSISSLNKTFLSRHQLLNNSQLWSQGLCNLITEFIHYTKKCKLNEGTKLHCAKKVVSDSPELVDFTIRLKFFEEVTGKFITEFITEELWNQFSSSKRFWGWLKRHLG